jgi:hypothetical protein
MDRKTLIGHTRAQLLAIAGSFSVRRRHKMTKGQLVDILTGMVLDSHRKNPELPFTYGKTGLTLLEVDPNLAHAFWEVATGERQLRELQNGPSGTPFWVLRFYGNGNGIQKLFDEEVSISSGSWYVRLRTPHKVLFAELGVKTPSGSFRPVCKSNPIGAPPETDLSSPGWLKVEPSGEMQPESAPSEHPPVFVESAGYQSVQSRVSARRESLPSSFMLGMTVFRKA